MDFKGHSPRTHVKKGDLIESIDHRSSSKERNRWMRRIAGPRHAQMLIFLERASIRTMNIHKWIRGSTRRIAGEKRVGLKPLLSCYAITH
jgi:hypothetical protein